MAGHLHNVRSDRAGGHTGNGACRMVVGWDGQVWIGNSVMARGAAKFFSGKGAAVSIAGPSDNAAAKIARTVGVRHVNWNAAHDVKSDVLVFADRGTTCGSAKGQINPTLIHERSIVVDLTVPLRESAFAEEARAKALLY